MADGVWSIEANPASTQGYSITQDGVATFPDNPTTEEIVYTIKYTPNGTGAKSCVRVVKQKGKEDDPIIYRNPDPSPNPDDDETTDFTFEDGCKENYQWIKVKTINEMTITSFSITPSGWGTIEPAPSGGYKTNQYYKMTFPSLLPGVSKELSISATVDGGKRTSSIKFNTTCSTVCDCNSIQFIKGSNITAAATSVVFGTYTMKDNCYADKVTIVKVSDEHDVVKWNTTGRTHQGNTYSLTAQTNPHTNIPQDYEFSFKLKYDTTECTTVYVLKQTHDLDCDCGCITVSKPTSFVFDRKERDALFGYVTFKSDSCKTACLNNISFVPLPGVAAISNPHLEIDSGLRYKVVGHISQSDDSRKVTLKIMIGSEECSRLSVYQRCWRGTDNGVDAFYDDDGVGILKEKHPILLCGCMHNGHYDADSDTIVVEEVQILKPDGVTWVYMNTVNESNALIYDGWLKVYWSSVEGLPCGQGSIITQALSEHTGTEAREYTVQLKSTSSDPVICDKAQHAGETACSYWEYPVMQAPKCHGWCKIGSNENRQAKIFRFDTSCSIKYHEDWEKAIQRDETHEQLCCYIGEQEGCGTPQCAVSMTLINNAPATGTPRDERMVVGTYTTDCDSSLCAGLEFISGGGDFLYDIKIANGQIKAQVAPNNSGAIKVSRYRLVYGFATTEAEITQLV